MAIKIGISLIAWQNDDLPELTMDFTTEGAMEDAARIGYAGVERGRRMPADTGDARVSDPQPPIGTAQTSAHMRMRF